MSVVSFGRPRSGPGEGGSPLGGESRRWRKSVWLTAFGAQGASSSRASLRRSRSMEWKGALDSDAGLGGRRRDTVFHPARWGRPGSREVATGGGAGRGGVGLPRLAMLPPRPEGPQGRGDWDLRDGKGARPMRLAPKDAVHGGSYESPSFRGRPSRIAVSASSGVSPKAITSNFPDSARQPVL